MFNLACAWGKNNRIMRHYFYVGILFCFPGPEDHKDGEVMKTENSQQESTSIDEQHTKVNDDNADCGS